MSECAAAGLGQPIRSAPACITSRVRFRRRAATYVPRSTLPVYARQLFPDPLIGEKFDTGKTLLETDGVRLWHARRDDIGIVSFKTKMHTIGRAVLDGMQQARSTRPSAISKRVVIWQDGEPFSRRRRISKARSRASMKAGKPGDFEQMVSERFQQTQHAHQVFAGAGRRRGARHGVRRRLRIPDAFGAHGRRARELYRTRRSRRRSAAGRRRSEGNRAARVERAAVGGDVFTQLKSVFETVAMAKVSGSALEAQGNRACCGRTTSSSSTRYELALRRQSSRRARSPMSG